ncbi:MAG: caspase family protein [Nitrospirae bacterium]|nr:caspase family protein [Nitrospirota bacterium]
MYKSIKIFIIVLILFIFNITPLVYAKTKKPLKNTIDNAQTSDNRSIELKAMVSEKRVALVIGNGDYKNIKKLRNPVNDAQAMASVLKGLNFKVISGFNLTQKDMRKIISQFGDEISNGGVGLFYFAGHGIQIKGENYLIPVDADVHSEKDVDPEAINANIVLENMAYAKNRLNIVILDACRDNPFKGFRSAGGGGLAQMKAPEGTYIAYATSPGSVASDGDGQNGLYTQELIKNMEKPGLQIEQMFKGVRESVKSISHDQQTPWESTSITGEFYFKIDTNVKPSTVSESASLTPQKGYDAETEAWAAIKDSKDPQDFKEFITAFPNSSLAVSARLKMRQLEKPQPSSQQTNNPPQITSSKPAETITVPPPPKKQGRPSTDGRYIDNEDGTITDTRSGLMWGRLDSFADLGKCLDWNMSKSYVKGLKTGGYSDWRLPTVKELRELYEQSKTNKDFSGDAIYIDLIFASGGAHGYWSSEESGACCARPVGFHTGLALDTPKDRCFNLGVRPVRSGR